MSDFLCNRVQVESYINDGSEQKLAHCASCQVKIFKVSTKVSVPICWVLFAGCASGKILHF